MKFPKKVITVKDIEKDYLNLLLLEFDYELLSLHYSIVNNNNSSEVEFCKKRLLDLSNKIKNYDINFIKSVDIKRIYV